MRVVECSLSLEPLIEINAQIWILDTSSTTSTSESTTVSGVLLLTLAWAVCTILIVAGYSTKRNRVYSSGIVASGIMTIVTPLVYYIYETVRLGVFPASVLDFLIVAALSTLGGGIISIGVLKLTRRAFPTPSGP